MAERPQDPYFAYNFHVEINGIQVGGFSEVSGLSIETEIETIKEGGVNETEYKLLKGTKYSNITLKHGMIDRDELWSWYQDIIHGNRANTSAPIRRKRKTVNIYLNDSLKQNVWQWYIIGAYPVKWDGPAFNATGNAIAIETLVLAHQGIKKV